MTNLYANAGTQANNEDFIATWKDKSGRGADASQPTGGIQPVYETDQLNGFGAVIFQNNTQYMTGPTGAYQTVVSTRTMLGNSYQYLFSSPANTDFSVRFNASASPTFVLYSSGNITLTFNFNDYNGTSPNPAGSFTLLYNPSDGTFASGTNTLVPTASSNVSGNSVSFVVNATNVPNGYYTAKWTVDPGSGWGYFALQRSTDGLQFTSIGAEAATDNNSIAENYSYTDNSPSPGINYYRLAMVNAAGVTSCSPIRTLTFSEPSCPVTLYPIPTKDILHISAPGISEARNIDLVSVTGQVLASYSISRLDGSNLSVSRFPAGSYFVRILGGGQSYVLPFLKL